MFSHVVHRLVELIILNVCLSAGVLDKVVSPMFVLEALLLTFATTPIVTMLSPSHLGVRVTTTRSEFQRH